MKSLILIAILTFLIACSKPLDAELFDLEAIERDSIAIIQSESISLDELPESISNLNPEHLRLDDLGLFITLNSFLVSEEGLFVLRVRTVAHTTTGADPEFKKLSKNVYSYSVKG